MAKAKPIEFKTILEDPWGTMRGRIQSEIFIYQVELEDEFGDFSIEEIPDSYEIKLVSEGGEEFRCYLSDWHVDARLIIDDYWPTPEDHELDINQASDQAPPIDGSQVEG